MSSENRPGSALFKRAEQLRRWEESETNREPETPRDRQKKIQFSLGCVFLAACASGDKEEVVRLLQVGADIDTTNVDGLSALHQACIDDNLDMVEFLVKHGADINKGDNEGWTPLHATSSCGFISVAKYLIEQGADIAAVNNDGELAVDIAESDEMEDLLQQVLDERGIDCEKARSGEKSIMLKDANEWLKTGKFRDVPHQKTGATALHVAAAKGYFQVMRILLQAGADVNAQDYDGWTPLHAAAHWGHQEACEILAEQMCDMNIENYVGQTAFDLADTHIAAVLEDLMRVQSVQQSRNKDLNSTLTVNNNNNKETYSPKRRSSISRLSVADKSVLIKERDTSTERQTLDKLIVDDDGSPTDKVPKVEREISSERNANDEKSEALTGDSGINDGKQSIPVLTDHAIKVPNSVPTSPTKQNAKESGGPNVPGWRRVGSLRTIVPKSEGNINAGIPGDEEKSQDVALRRTQSFESDEKFYRKYCELRAKIRAAGLCPTLPPPKDPQCNLPTRSSSLKESSRKTVVNDDQSITRLKDSSAVTAANTTITNTFARDIPRTLIVNSGKSDGKNAVAGQSNQSLSAPVTPTSPPSPGSGKLSPGNIFRNFIKSFVPPVRDEESETQRKAHAKRVRETRRSTQGVTLEEIKSAEQLVKKKQQQQTKQQTPADAERNCDQNDEREHSPVSVSATISATDVTGTPRCNNHFPERERRPSWRLRIDNGSKFMLEDARRNEKENDPASEQSQRWSVSQPCTIETTDTTVVTLPLRKSEGNQDTKNAQAAQAAIQRKRRPKRRSTGVVQVDMDEIDPEKQDASGDANDNLADESGADDKSGRSSRLSSTSSVGADSTVGSGPEENAECDYKKLYEQTLIENEILREKLRNTEADLANSKSNSSELANNKSSLSEIEKREKRAMERKLSEMEEELKQLQKLKAENERLRAENRALTRVVSKLTTSANAIK